MEFSGIASQAIGVAEKHLNPRTQPPFPRVIILRPSPCHVQFKAAHRQRWVFGAQAAGGGQGFGGVVRHGRQDVGAGQQGAQAVGLRYGEYDMALAAEFLQFFIDEPAQAAGE